MDDQVVDPLRMPLQSPDHLAFQMWLAWSKKTRCLRDFCVIQWCFVVLSGEFATDIPRAWLLKINDLQNSKFPVFPSLRASNQVVGSSNLSGRATVFLYENSRSRQAVRNRGLSKELRPSSGYYNFTVGHSLAVRVRSRPS
jgi:hypothetical protein